MQASIPCAAVPTAGRRRTLSALFIFLLLTIATAAWANTAPAAPSGIWVNPSNTANSIYWNSVPGASSYNLYRGTTSGGEVLYKTGLGTSYGDGSLTNGSAFYYKVTALYGTTEGPQSAEASGIPNNPPNIPPTPIVAASPSSGSVNLHWSMASGATSYDVFRYDPTYGWQWYANSTTTTYTDSGVSNGVVYTYGIEAVNSSGAGSLSNQPTAVPGDAALSAPTGLYAYGNNGSASVYWNAVPGAVNYNIYVSTTSGGEGTTPYAVGIGTSYGAGGLTNGTTYYFKVTAVDQSGESMQSVEISASPNNPAPTIGTPALAAKSSSPTALPIALHWTPVTGATRFDIFRSIGNTSNYILYQETAGTATTYSDTAVTAGVIYYYIIVAADTATTSGNSDTASAIPEAAGLPGPTGPYVWNENGYNNIYWNNTPVLGATSYNIYRGTTATTQKLLATNLGTSYSDSAVSNGTTYYYKITPVFGDTEGKASPVVSGTPNNPITRLLATTLSGTLVSGKITLDWSTVSGATTYNVFRAPLNGSYTLIKFAVKPPVSGNVVTLTDGTATAGTEFSYQVYPVDKDGMGTNVSNTVVMVSKSSQPIPTNGTIAFAGNGGVDVYWNTVPNASSYDLYRSTTSGGEGTVPYAVNLGTSYGDSNVSNGTTYYYKVSAVDNNGQSTLGTEVSATPNNPPSVLAAPVVTLNAAATQNNLAWNAVAGATGYDIFRATYGQSYVQLTQNSSGTTYSDTGLTAGLNYNYYVYAIDAAGAGNRSNTVSGTPGSTPPAAPSGIEAVAGANSASIYWNAVLGAASYNIYRGTTSGGEGSVPIAVNLGTSYGDSTVSNGNTYYYKATAVDANGQSLLSQECSVVPGSTALAAPTMNAPTVSGGAIKLTWSTVSGATTYDLFRALTGQNYVLYQQGLTTASYSDSGVVPGATYYYYVAGVNTNGVGATSGTVNDHT